MTTYEPGLYYMSRKGGEVRKLLGERPPQADLFKDFTVLPDGRWAYTVIWSPDKNRRGMTFTCLAKSFQAWGSLLTDQDWWKRVEDGTVRYFAPLDIWLDEEADLIVVPTTSCDCEYREGFQVSAKDLREFLRAPGPSIQ